MVTTNNLVGTDISGYIVTKYISSGSFGSVWSAKNKNGKEVALKIPIEENGQKWLIEEAHVYKVLNKKKNFVPSGICRMKVIKFEKGNAIVMDLLGMSLEDYIKSGKLRLKSIILLAIQMITLIQYIHECGYIHRDIKPDNFVMGTGINSNVLYCIDFGMAKKYLKSDGNHLTFKTDLKFCGTARFSSIASHIGNTQSRKDDLEAIGYVLVYLYRATLPWMGIKHKDKKERYRLISEKKKNISEEDLCKQLPKQFLIYLKYVKSLDYNEDPHYRAMIKMFEKLYAQKEYSNNIIFE